MIELPVRIRGAGLLCPAGIGADGARGGRPGPVPGFRARAYIRDRKSLKLMARSVKLGVSAVTLALSDAGDWASIPPARRALFVGASPQPGDAGDLQPALEASLVDNAFSVTRFAEAGYPLIHPLWLLRGLSNNVLGFASAAFDLQGVNTNYCDGPRGGWGALLEGARAVAEGRADIAIAGGVDSLVGADPFFSGRICGEGAAFVVFERSRPDDPPLCFSKTQLNADEQELGYLGAATWPVAFVRWYLQQSSSS